MKEPAIHCPIKYDRYGRMFYHPDMHSKHKRAWTNKDEQYLIENYVIDGAVSVSLALGRTSKTVQQRVRTLRKEGKMPEYQPGQKRPRRGD